MALKDSLPVGISEDIVGLTGVANCMLVSGLFQLHAKRWSRFFIAIIDTKRFGMPPKMPKLVKKAERFAIFYFIYCCVGVLAYAFYSIIKAAACKKANFENGTHETCGMITPFWWPFEHINPMLKVFFNLYQLVSVLLILPPSAMVTFASWESSQIIVTKIHHLKDLFSDVFREKDFQKQKERLRFCIEYHQHTLELSKELNIVNRMVVGQSSFSSAIILGCIGSQILKEYSAVAFLHLMGYSVAVFLICETGQNILEETLKVQDAVYASNWHLAYSGFVKDIQLILLRCQKPILLRGYLFETYSNSLLIVIVKTAYSYLTLMNNIGR